MRLMEDMKRRGELIGLRINRDNSFLYELFTDDTTLFIQNSQREFDQAMGAIRMFEMDSRASLNVDKSFIIPMTPHPTRMVCPHWLSDPSST